ncbi:tetratricopeptide repeat protein, partial [Chitinophagales bacterium]|nr:tetratricopeptide repeat protein [Chitinophagales bacterium]
NNFGNTKAGNLAKYYAGLSYFQLGDYPNAEKYLAKFNVKNDEVLGGLALGTLADAQMENANRDAALKNYKKAANFSDNEASSPFLLLKAGLAYDYAGKSEDAIKFLKTLEDKYPNSSEASDAAKYLAKIEASI